MCVEQLFYYSKKADEKPSNVANLPLLLLFIDQLAELRKAIGRLSVSLENLKSLLANLSRKQADTSSVLHRADTGTSLKLIRMTLLLAVKSFDRGLIKRVHRQQHVVLMENGDDVSKVHREVFNIVLQLTLMTFYASSLSSICVFSYFSRPHRMWCVSVDHLRLKDISWALKNRINWVIIIFW